MINTDSKEICLWIPVSPVAKGRPRATKTGRVYTPAKTKQYEEAVAAAAAVSWGVRPVLDGPLEMKIFFMMPRRKSDKGEDIIPHFQRPDLDNLEKALLDALNGIVFHDDAQVCLKRSAKMRAFTDSSDGTLILVRKLDPDIFSKDLHLGLLKTELSKGCALH